VPLGWKLDLEGPALHFSAAFAGARCRAPISPLTPMGTIAEIDDPPFMSARASFPSSILFQPDTDPKPAEQATPGSEDLSLLWAELLLTLATWGQLNKLGPPFGVRGPEARPGL